MPPAVSVTGVAVAVTFVGEPSVDVTLVVKETVPAKLLEVSVSMAVLLLPAVMDMAELFAVSV